MPEHLEDDRDVEQILKLAVRSAGFSDEEALRQRLHAAGAELGLTDAQIAAAEERYKEEKAEMLERAEFESYAVKEFWEHFWAYIIVNAGLVAFDLFGDGRLSWAMWPLIGWGIGLAFHAYSVYFPSQEGYEEEFMKWRGRQSRRRRRRDRRIDAIARRYPKEEEEAKADQ